MKLDLKLIEDLCDRRANGFASIEHESALMDTVPALLARIADLERLSASQEEAHAARDRGVKV